MGKGDKRSKRGKIWRGSYGKTRPKKEVRIEQTEPKTEKPKAS